MQALLVQKAIEHLSVCATVHCQRSAPVRLPIGFLFKPFSGSFGDEKNHRLLGHSFVISEASLQSYFISTYELVYEYSVVH